MNLLQLLALLFGGGQQSPNPPSQNYGQPGQAAPGLNAGYWTPNWPMGVTPIPQAPQPVGMEQNYRPSYAFMPFGIRGLVPDWVPLFGNTGPALDVPGQGAASYMGNTGQ